LCYNKNTVHLKVVTNLSLGVVQTLGDFSLAIFMKQNPAEFQPDIPLGVELYRKVLGDLETRFHPGMAELSEEIEQQSLQFREYMESKKWIRLFEGQPYLDPIVGVDASNVTSDDGEIAVGLAVGVVSSIDDQVRPIFSFASIFGSPSETFSRAVNFLRVSIELDSLKQTTSMPQWTLYDGSFAALNMEVCRFASAITKDSPTERDLMEASQLTDAFDRSINNPDSGWFQAMGESGAHKLISIGKRGTSKVYTEGCNLFRDRPDGFLPADKLMLSRILQAGEYTDPFSYEQAYKDSHGSEVPGYGEPSLKNYGLKKMHKKVQDTYRHLRCTYFRPWPWSPVLKIEYNHAHHSVEEVLAVVAGSTQMRSVMEPQPLYLADLQVKQAASAIQFYGPINAARYPFLFAGYRTSTRH
jgi:hypothetical protein